MTSVAYRWDVEAFLRAHAAGVFSDRVELVDGEIWPVVLGTWHGDTTGAVFAALQGQGRTSASTLPSGDSLPDPDVWVRRPDARPAGSVSPRLLRWAPDDVLLVVEVADETLHEDLTVKARLYARTGWVRYWVVARDGVHDHTGPGPRGYSSVRLVGPDDEVTLPDGTPLPVGRLLGQAQPREA